MRFILNDIWDMVSYVSTSTVGIYLTGLVSCVLVVKIINRLARR